MHIDMGDDGRNSVLDITLKYVVYVLGLKKNLVSVSMSEDYGYDVIFRKGKDFLHHIATGQEKKIGVRVKNLYMLDVEDCASLSIKVEKVQS